MIAKGSNLVVTILVQSLGLTLLLLKINSQGMRGSNGYGQFNILGT